MTESDLAIDEAPRALDVGEPLDLRNRERPLGSRARTVAARAWAVPWLAPVGVAWLATRVLILATAWCSSWLATQHVLRYAEPVLRRGPHSLSVLGGWDGGWYRLIARVGYPTHLDPHHYSRLAFFPLLPALIALVQLTGVSSLVAGLIVTNLAALGALVAAAALTERYFDAETAERAAVYLAISPMAFVLGMVYTEALLLACGFGAAALLLRGRPWLAAALGLACGLSRPTGVLIAVPLAAIAWRTRGRRASSLTAAAAPLVGLGLFAAYAWRRTGDATVFLRAEATWGRHGVSIAGAETVVRRLVSQLGGSPSPWALRDAAALVLTLALVAYGAWRRFPVSWLVFGAACVVVPAASGSTQSLARFALFSLPAFWALAVLGRHRSFDSAYRVLAPAAMAIGMLTLPLHWP
jgi:hypothetical protein